MRKFLILFFFGFLFAFPITTNAASVSVAGTTATGVVGGNITVRVTLSEASGLGSWEYSLTYDTNKLQLLSGSTHVVGYVEGAGETSRTYTYSFRVKDTGTTTISVINTSIADWNENVTSPTDSTTIELVNNETATEKYSTNNNLESLEIEGHSLDPSFSSDVTNYKVELESDVTKIKINASPSDSKAKVSGTGEFDVHSGNNSFNIVVTAESGATKTYTIDVNVKEPNPIEVKVDDISYTVVRNKEELNDLVKGYMVETTVHINDEDVLAYHIDSLDLTLVALKDEEGDINFYIYDDGKYEPYYYLSDGTIDIHIIDNAKEMPKNYKLFEQELNGLIYNVYKLDKNSQFFLVYGENIETGDKNIYRYDLKDNTIQRYDSDELSKIEEENQVKQWIMLGMLGLIVILLIILLVLLHNKSKKKKQVKQDKRKIKEEQKEFLK